MYLKFNVEYFYFAESSTFSPFILDSQLFFLPYLTFQWTQKTPNIPSASGISSLPFLLLIFAG
jgi:hypothetical protein